MMTFTYITATIITIGIICILIPRKWYENSQLDLRVGGMWLAMITFGLQGTIWIIYGIIILVKFLFLTYVLTWGNAI